VTRFSRIVVLALVVISVFGSVLPAAASSAPPTANRTVAQPNGGSTNR
jgi:hypothetical protein